LGNFLTFHKFPFREQFDPIRTSGTLNNIARLII